MGVVHVAASLPEPRGQSFAFNERPDFGTPLLQMKDRFPAVYGALSYEDPELNYLRVRTYMTTPVGLPEVTWSGTREEFQQKWEGCLPRGAV